MIRVPAAENMTDDNFRQHLNLRHLPEGDWADLTELQGGAAFPKNRKAYQAYHIRLHEMGEYEHEHKHP